VHAGDYMIKMMPKIINGFSAVIFIEFIIQLSEANDIEDITVPG
jgi:hypothetical protein